MIGNAFHSVGADHPRFPAIVRAIRAGHLRLLARLLAPGGRAFLITDVVSSETLPELGSLPDAALPELLGRLDREGNHFHGTGPSDLTASLLRDPVLASRTVERGTVAPWRWKLHHKVYLVWALTFQAPDLVGGTAAGVPRP